MKRLAGGIERARRWIVVASIAVTLIAAAYASGLRVYTDFSYLLPPSARSVQDLRAIEKRARSIGTVMIAVESDDPDARQRVAQRLRDGIGAIDHDLVSSVTFDDAIARRFAWEHRWLYATLDDLTRARDALKARIARGKAQANPLFVDLEDKPTDGVDDLQAKLKDAEAKSDAPSALVSKDGTLQLVIVHTAFSAGDSGKGAALLAAIRRVVDPIRTAEPGVQIGIAGDVVVTLAEHDSILHGMELATIVTVVLVLLGLFGFYRSMMVVGALAWSLAVGAISTFALTRATIGHLNLATAFLSSIVVGNGINVGIIVAARYLEELRGGYAGAEALGRTLAGTWRATVAATLTTSTAYASLLVTDFRGFKDFGLIGGTGMVLCWISAYTVLPACLAVAGRSGRLRRHDEPALGHLLSRLVPTRAGAVIAIVLALGAASAGVAVWFFTHHPFESNFRNLRTHNAQLDVEEHWMGEVDRGFGQGISGGFVIALPDRAEVAPLVARLRALDAGKDERDRLFSRVSSLDDVLPSDQDAKIAVLREIDAQLTPDALDEMSPDDRATVEKLRPPRDLRPLVDADLPGPLADQFTEADGTRGKLIFANSGRGYEIWNADDLVRFSDDVRKLDLGDAKLGGNAFVFADMVRGIERDGPRATLIAIVGSVLVVLLVLGWSRHAAITLLSGTIGTSMMLALGALLGMHVNFLDFVALPITIGIGVDYSVNIAARDRVGAAGQVREAVRAVGGAVVLCSFTTIVGYGTLLLSENRAIRSFGSAAILGELTCVTAAIVLTPAMLHAFATRAMRSRQSGAQ